MIRDVIALAFVAALAAACDVPQVPAPYDGGSAGSGLCSASTIVEPTDAGTYRVCALVEENPPPATPSELFLCCPTGTMIGAIDFAAYGVPNGSCGSYSMGGSCGINVAQNVASYCQGQVACSVPVSNQWAGTDPCPNVIKRMAVQAECVPAGTLPR